MRTGRIQLARWLFGLALLLMGNVGFAQDEIDINRHIRSLDSDDYEAREASMRAIEKFGVQAVPLLKRALENDETSLEAKLRLKELLRHLEEAIVAPTGVMTATRVSLDLVDTTLTAALAALQKSSGLTFRANPVLEKSQKITLSIKNLPMFEALDRIADAAGFSWRLLSGNPHLMLYENRMPAAPIRRYVGPARLELTTVTRSGSLTFGREPTKSLALSGRLDIEPWCELLSIAVPPTPVTATTSDGKSLLFPAENYAQAARPTVRNRSFPFSVGLKNPTSDIERIAKLELKFRADIASGFVKLKMEVPEADRSQGPDTVVGNYAARVGHVNKRGAQYAITLAVEGGSALSILDGRNRIASDRIVGYLADGSRIEPVVPPTRNYPANARESVYVYFTKRPVMIELTMIAGLKEKTFQLEFKNIELP